MWKVFLIVMALYSFCLSLLLDSPLSCHAVACRHRLHFFALLFSVLLFSHSSFQAREEVTWEKRDASLKWEVEIVLRYYYYYYYDYYA